MNFRHRLIPYTEGENITPSNATKSTIEALALEVAGVARFKPGDDPADIVTRLGGQIHYESLDSWMTEDGSIFVHGDSDFDVVLSRYTSPLRDRFTIAHELGHYFVHSNQGEVPIVAYRKGTGRLEWEANWFAAALLMPRDVFRSQARKMDDIVELAAYFGVSTDAARVRKESLGV